MDSRATRNRGQLWLADGDRGMLNSLRDCLVLVPKRERWQWLVSIPLAATAAAMEALGAAAVFGLVKIIGDPTQVSQMPGATTFIAWLPWRNPRTIVLVMTLLVGALYLTKNVLLAVLVWTQSQAAHDSWIALSQRMLRAYLSAPLAFHLRRNSTELIHNSLEAADVVFRMVVSPSVASIAEALVVLGIVCVLLLTAPGATVLAVALLCSLLALMLRATRRILTRWGTREQAQRQAVLQTLQQTFEGFKEVKLRGREQFFQDTFGRQHRSLVTVRHRFTALSTISRLFVETVFITGILLVVLLVTFSSQAGPNTVPILGVYAYAGFRIIPSVNRILNNVTSVRYGLPAVRRLRDDLRICEPYTTSAAVAATGARALAFTESLVIDHVSYTYEGGHVPVLQDVSLTVRRGESIGIVGSTGAGKSTLINLVLGLLAPRAGRILVDGIDIAPELPAWQRKIGYVPQVVYLIDDTLRRNIAFALADEEIDDIRVRAAVHMAQLEGFLAALPLGLNTLVGERGVRLSGGERQRVAIARALYHEPELLIFDEATSALDNQTERELTQAIDALHGQKTLLIIAHRLSTVHGCDRLVFLHRGQVAGMGSFDELLATNADFRSMASSAPMGDVAGDPTPHALS